MASCLKIEGFRDFCREWVSDVAFGLEIMLVVVLRQQLEGKSKEEEVEEKETCIMNCGDGGEI